jgi:hypothetical protein
MKHARRRPGRGQITSRVLAYARFTFPELEARELLALITAGA